MFDFFKEEVTAKDIKLSLNILKPNNTNNNEI